MKPRAIFGFSAILLLFVALNGYIGWNGQLLLNAVAPGFPEPLYWMLFAIVVFGYIIGRTKMLPGPAARLLKVIGAYYIAVFEFAVLLLPPADLIGWLLKRGGAGVDIYLVTVGFAVIGVLAVLLIAGWRNAWHPIVRTYRLTVPKAAGKLKELHIVMASDIHLGNVVGNRHLRRLIDAVNELQPDLVLLPGDVIDDDIEPFVRNRMADTMRKLRARFGVFAVLGNHEYYGGHIDEYIKRMKEIGIRVLRDETVDIDGLFGVAGRKDKTAESMEGGRLPVARLLAQLDSSKPIIVMDHQPYQFDKASEAGADLLLCGHTHRGQFAPNHLVTKRLFELDWGYMEKNGMHVIVSSGFGTWGPPVRLASRSEIISIRLAFR